MISKGKTVPMKLNQCRAARQLVSQLKSATDGPIPFFTSDALPHYTEALLDVYGVWMTPVVRKIITELVASFPSRRRFSHAPRWRATASYERGAVRTMRAAPWQHRGEHA